ARTQDGALDLRECSPLLGDERPPIKHAGHGVSNESQLVAFEDNRLSRVQAVGLIDALERCDLPRLVNLRALYAANDLAPLIHGIGFARWHPGGLLSHP